MPIIPQHQLTICNKNKTIQYIYGSCINIDDRYPMIPMFNNWLNEINPMRDRGSRQWIQERPGTRLVATGSPFVKFTVFLLAQHPCVCLVPGPSEKCCQPVGFG